MLLAQSEAKFGSPVSHVGYQSAISGTGPDLYPHIQHVPYIKAPVTWDLNTFIQSGVIKAGLFFKSYLGFQKVDSSYLVSPCNMEVKRL